MDHSENKEAHDKSTDAVSKEMVDAIKRILDKHDSIGEVCLACPTIKSVEFLIATIFVNTGVADEEGIDMGDAGILLNRIFNGAAQLTAKMMEDGNPLKDLSNNKSDGEYVH